ncbi:hypothetical protein E2C01_070653 [Portunus trituberculatus]|uniref:Uncharacterized protein n=1 Tax=Portunus trituberculatus TaxID=210409 RepID=A0A5B7I2P4_PORTR|nr:hypothetical protein [Portunus trituberculatus]
MKKPEEGKTGYLVQCVGGLDALPSVVNVQHLGKLHVAQLDHVESLRDGQTLDHVKTKEEPAGYSVWKRETVECH